MRLENDLVIQCDSCGEVIVIDKDTLDVDVFSYERNMGEEIEYDFIGETKCDKCGKPISYKVMGFEYPVGAYNYDCYECAGGTFLQSPSVSVEYFEFEYDDYEEDYLHDKIFKVQSNIDEIIRDNNKLYSLDPREFEELVAELFRRQGYEVVLTQETRDGGYDIVAKYKKGDIPFLVLIECKRYKQTNKVGVGLVRALMGVQNDRKANKAVLVTTSSFSKDAVDFAARQQHLISLVGFDEIMRLIREYK